MPSMRPSSAAATSAADDHSDAAPRHSPGPWDIYQPDDESGYRIMYTHAAGRIAIVDGPSNNGMEQELRANAHMIAAAPTMLDALREALAALHQVDEHHPAKISILTAIAKAEGRV